METTILKTNLHCQSCLNKIEPILKSDKAIKNYKIDLSDLNKTITIESEGLDIDQIIEQIGNIGYSASELNENIQIKNIKKMPMSWHNISNWKRASFNTLNCLIGCSIGDFGMLIFLQAYYPDTSMAVQMILAIIAGLATSITLESTILKVREKFNWSLALKTAFSMSFISMIGMEVAMNATDFMITGGKAAFNTWAYWIALFPAMIAGFVLPLPYNYYKLQKHGKSCH